MFDSVPVDVAAMFGGQPLTVMGVQRKDAYNPNRVQGELPQQARTKDGRLKWKVQVMGVELRRSVDGETYTKGDTFDVSIALAEGVNLRELLSAGKPIVLDGLRFGGFERRGSDDKKTGGYGLYWSASGITSFDGQPFKLDAPALAGAN